MSDVRVCPQCGTEYGDDLRFCPKDGTALRPRAARPDLVGQVIADRYHVSRKLGEGGMGEVYLAEHVKMGRLCALKVIRRGVVHQPDVLARFTREAGNASRIAHPNVAAIYDFGETPDGLVFLAMEFVDGESLHALLAREGAIAPQRVAAVVRKVADALADAHALGIVHRDLKPENIMLSRARDGSDVVKVVDFGIAKAVEGERQTVTRMGFVVGTPDYMSPEQLSGEPLDGKSDQYALALVAFHMLTGSLPFPGKTEHESMVKRLTDRPLSLAQARSDVAWPRELQEVFDRALARRPDERFEGVVDFASALGGCVRRWRADGIGEAAIGQIIVMPDTEEAPRLSGMVGFSEVVGRPEPLPAAAEGRAPATPTAVRSTRERQARHTGLRSGIIIGGAIALVAAGTAMVMMRSRNAALSSRVSSPGDSAARGRDSAVASLGSAPPNDSLVLQRIAPAPKTASGAEAPPMKPAADAGLRAPTTFVMPTTPDSAPLGGARGDPGPGPQGQQALKRDLTTPTGNPALDAAMASVRRGLAAVDSIARLDPEAFTGLRRPAPGARPQRGRDLPAPSNPREAAARSLGARRALDGIESVVDAAVAGRVTEEDLLSARQAVERLEREPIPQEEKRRARYYGLMLQALITKSPVDCRSLRMSENFVRRSPAQVARVRSVMATACRA